jgi:hypothetical protein
MFLKMDPLKMGFGIADSLNRRGIKRARKSDEQIRTNLYQGYPEVMTSLRVLADRQSLLLSEFIRQTLTEKVSRLMTGEASNEGGLVHRKMGDVPFQYRYR